MMADRRPSPNCNERPAGQTITLLVIHNISLPPGQYKQDWVSMFFGNRLPADAHPYFAEIHQMQVSAHLLIRRNGNIIQYVPFDMRAWHAGRSSFAGEPECNDYSIGIEMEGTDKERFTAEQYQSLGLATKAIQQRYPKISAERITGHSHIAPGRKTDPGPCFDWGQYRKLIKN